MAPESSSQSIAGAQWLDWPETKQVFAAISSGGGEVRAVGGAVRDTLLGRPVREVDMAATASPDRVMELAAAAGLKAIPTGISHGTVTVVAGGKPFEVTTLRKDVETFGRRAKVAFTQDWAEDASRRDFTINALYASAEGELFDPLGGLEDLAALRLRFIGDPRQRIREDYLRILRFFRLGAELEISTYEADSLSACVAQRAGLEGLSAERIHTELVRLLAAPAATTALGLMFDYGLLVAVLGGVPRLDRFRRLESIEAELGTGPDPVLRLSALALWVKEDAVRLFERFRLSNADRAKLDSASEFRNVVVENTDISIQWGLYRYGREDFMCAALVAWAESGKPAGDPDWRGMVARIAELPVPGFPVSGKDVIALGVPEGPAVGEVLNALEVHWMSEGFAADRDALLKLAAALGHNGS